MSNALNNLVITNLANGDMLIYQNGMWRNKSAAEIGLALSNHSHPDLGGGSGSVAELDDIGDVTITLNTNGEILKWDGSAWVNNTLAEAGIAAASHSHAASDINSGTIDTARLGSGAADNTSFLRGDQTWQTISATVTALDDVGDVVITSIASGEILKWDGANWINQTLAEAGIAASVHNHAASDINSGTLDTARLGSGTADNTTYLRGDQTWATVSATVASLDDIGDVVITSIASGEILKWNGANWINNTLAEAGIAAASHTHDASDVNSGTMATARLGSGTASATTVLAGDQTYRTKTLRIPLLIPIHTAVAWTNMPAAEDFLFGNIKTITKADLAGYTQVRFLVMKSSIAGAVGAKLYLKGYHLAFSSSVASYLNMSATDICEVAIDTTDTHLESAWSDMRAVFKADDIWIAVTGDGGNEASDPQFGQIVAEFR